MLRKQQLNLEFKDVARKLRELGVLSLDLDNKLKYVQEKVEEEIRTEWLECVQEYYDSSRTSKVKINR